MVPETIEVTKEKEQPSLTYNIDFSQNKVIGKIDNLEALKQSIYIILNTERDSTPIYMNYGIKLIDLIGKDIYLVVSELKRRITSALLEDNRINSIDQFNFEENKDGLLVEFILNTIYGNTKVSEVYSI